MPGVLIYRSIAAAVRIAAAGVAADPAVATLSLSAEAAFVVAAMVIGLVTGASCAGFLPRPARKPRRSAPPRRSRPAATEF
jgi:hypothetical protein